MNTLTIEKKNLATTSRPDEYKGTIALDHRTAGLSIEEIIRPFIDNHIQEGYLFEGLSLLIAQSHSVIKDNKLNVNIILSRLDNFNTRQFIKLKREIQADKFFLAFTVIKIQFSKGSNFEQDKIDWSNIPDPEDIS